MPFERPVPIAPRAPRPWPLFLVAAALVALAYGRSLAYPFTRDDAAHFSDAARWQRPPAAWGAHFREEFWAKGSRSGLYRPLTALTIQASVTAGGGLPATPRAPAPPLLRLGNFALLAAAAAAAGTLLLRLGASRGAALFATAVVALHPLLSEDALEIVSRSETQAALGVLLAAGILAGGALAGGAAAKARGEIRWGRAGLAGLCFLFALGSKEGAFAALPALLWLAGARLQPAMALCTAVLVALVGRVEVFGDFVGFDPAQTAFVDNPLIGAPPMTRLFTGVAVLGRQLAQLAWPAQLSVDWSYAAIVPQSAPDRWFLVGAAGAVVVLAWLLVALARGRRAEAFGLLLAGASWLLVSNVLRPVGTVMGERLFTLPAIGLVVALTAALSRGLASRGVLLRRAAAFVGLVFVAAAGARTWQRAADWRDGLALYEAAERVAPGSARVQATLAHILRSRDQPAAARVHAERAIELLPDYGKAHAELSGCLADARQYGAALVHLWLAAHAVGATDDDQRALQMAEARVLGDERGRLEFVRYGRERIAARPDLPLHLALAPELERVARGGG